MQNPFNPAFGTRPERFLGRDDIIQAFKIALKQKNSPWRSTIITGVRGSGKTATLAAVRHYTNKQKKIISVSVQANNDMLNDLLTGLYRQLPTDIFEEFPTLANISLLGFNFKVNDGQSKEPAFTNTFRAQADAMLEAFTQRKIAVVFLIDEVQKHTAELRTFVSAYQLFLQAGFNVSLMMAGLPNAITDILNDDVLTFMRRANRVALRNVNIELIVNDYTDAFIRGEKKISPELIRKSAELTEGYPYLIQLMGYYLWDLSADEIDDQVLKQALFMSKIAVFQNVHELIFREVSNVDRRILVAMSDDDGRTRMADLITRIGESEGYVSRYRVRLIQAGVIQMAGYGYVSYTLPYMDEYIRKLVADGEYYEQA